MGRTLHLRATICAALAATLAACAFPDYDFPGSKRDVGVDVAVDSADVADVTDSAEVDTADVDADAHEADADAVVETSSDADADVVDAPLTPPSCPSGSTGQNLCSTVPTHPTGTAVIDGRGDELCSIPALRFDSAASQWLEPDPLPSFAKSAHTDVRLAWIAGATPGLHLHAFVADPIHHVAASTDPANFGALLIAYLAGYDTVAGSFDGVTKDLGAAAYEMPPPGYASPDRIVMQYDDGQKGFASSGVEFATRLVIGGYEVEARIPWSELAPGKPAPVSGTKIALDFTLLVRDTGSTVVGLIYHVGAVTTAPTCAGDELPRCDDRTWCRPRLGP